MPAVSVIIPVFNASSFLDRCIASILDQSFSDFEAIFVDDGSSDQSVQVIRQFARNDSRIVLERHRMNSGPGSARNTGIAKARAKYLTFIDSDDFVDPNLLGTLLEATDGGFFDIIESGCRAIDGNENLLWEYCPVDASYANLGQVTNSMLLMREWAMHQKLWRRELFAENQIAFPEGVFWEDVAVIPVLVACARSLRKIGFVGYNYLQRTNSITSSRSAKHIADLFGAFEYFRRFLEQRSMYAKYKEAFETSVTNTVSYFLEHMRSRSTSDEELSTKLIRLCKVIADEYLKDKRIMEHMTTARLMVVIERALELDFNQADATLRVAVRRDLEADRVNRN